MELREQILKIKKYLLNKLVSKHSVCTDLFIVFSMMIVCTCYNLEHNRLKILNSIVPHTDVLVRTLLFIMLIVVVLWISMINGSTKRYSYLVGSCVLLLVPTFWLFITTGMELVSPALEFMDFCCKLIALWPLLLLNGGNYDATSPVYKGIFLLLLITILAFFFGYGTKKFLEKNDTAAKYIKK